jgi:hypothetical protein
VVAAGVAVIAMVAVVLVLVIPGDPRPRSGRAPTTTTAPLPALAFPGPDNTGVRPGSALSPSGPVVVTEAGTVLENLEIRGSVVIQADDVTVRNSRIILGDDQLRAVVIEDPDHGENYPTGALFEDVEVVGGVNCEDGFFHSNFTVRRADISGCKDGVKGNHNVVVEDSWIHDLRWTEESHNDGYQSMGGGNVVLRHNTIELTTTQTAPVFIQGAFAPVDGITVEGNLLAGGGYLIYCGDEPGRHPSSNVRVIGNTFSRRQFPNGGHWGVAAHCDADVTWEANVWEDTGEPVARPSS